MERLPSSKSSVKSYSSSLPPPAASSRRPTIHESNVDIANISTSETISQENYDNTKNLKEQEDSQLSISNDSSIEQTQIDENTENLIKEETQLKTEQQQNKKSILSDDSKSRAKILLEKLTRDMKNLFEQTNSNHIHPHISFRGIEHYKHNQFISQRSSMSSDDPHTDKLPPKSQRRSSLLNKNLEFNTHNTML